jgi:catechol 2,3-dioxygenase-like lactoylglutathione lyase family enzyme
MLNDAKVVATVAVHDINTAKEFYGGTLGLTQTDENPGGVTYTSGGSQLFVYQSDTGGTGQATSASWKVQDVDGTVESLKSKGVSFEHYDMPGVTLEGDVHVMGPMRSSWFKDPDGNILCVASDI